MRKVNLLCLFLMGLFLGACHSNDDTWGDWSKSNEFAGANRVQAVSFQAANGDVYIGMGYNNELDQADKNLKDFWKFNGSNWSRVQNGDFPDATGGRTGSVAFVIDNYAYVGAGWRRRYTGDKNDTYFSTFYVFDISKEEWVKGSLPGCKTDANGYAYTDIADAGFDAEECAFYSGIGFSMNGKGYAGTGQIKTRTIKTIFCFDPAKGWSDANFSGDSRVGAVTFTINNQAVVCLGTQGATMVRDVWTFDGTTWSSKAPLADKDGSWNDDYDKIPRSYAVAFTSNLASGSGIPRGYIAGGNGNGGTCWEYNLEDDRWDEVTGFPNAMGTMRLGAVGFSINQYGYITTGGTSLETANNNSTWKFTPGIDEDHNNDY